MTKTSRARVFLSRLIAIPLVFLLLIMLATGTLSVLYQDYCATRICFGVNVHGIALGGLTPQQATVLLEQELGASAPGLVLLYSETNQWTISNSSLGGVLDLDQAVAEAWQTGHSGTYRDDMQTRIRLLIRGYNIEPTYSLQTAQARTVLDNIAITASVSTLRSVTWVNGLQTGATDVTGGSDLDVAQTCQNIITAVQTWLGSSSWGKGTTSYTDISTPVAVPIAFESIVQPGTNTDAALAQLETMFQEPLRVCAVLDSLNEQGYTVPITKTWLIDRATLVAWTELDAAQEDDTTTLHVGLDSESIREWVVNIAKDIDQPSREGQFHYDSASQVLQVLLPGQIGYGVDVDASVKAIEKACLMGAADVHLVIRMVAPLVTREDLDAIMPLTLISQGETSFSGSSAERLQNIKVASACFDGITVPAQSTFSFLDRLGDVTVATGYSESWIIYGDRTVLGPGGGVCQVSTTCFRAAYYGGYPIVERHAHSYRVSWYEPPVGLDAAVFSPTTNMVFTNDTDNPILVQTIVDENASKLYFQFYSAPTGRVVEVSSPQTSNRVAAPDPIYTDDPSLPVGTTIQQEYAHEGIDTSIIRRIYVDGALVSEEELLSYYEPWAARYLVGTAGSEE